MPDTHWATLAFLEEMGFKVNLNNALASSPEEVAGYYKTWLERVEDLDYDCDGVVVKVNRFDYQQHLGYVGTRAALGRRLQVPRPPGRSRGCWTSGSTWAGPAA